eukprot:TRINITY_DN31043_c0_g1_i2.p1 TRINITY_DN31043_c0_g1~~TRINITY_DN31043_c0_g1_i2.p1  ORF type:complete len:983 (-),score=123.97 TRINITY_DN31043_c0_g1_i2:311-3259(-)
MLLNDSCHVESFFPESEVSFDALLAELKKRERSDGGQNTYWQNNVSLAVTRVRRSQDLAAFPAHAKVVSRMAQFFRTQIEGWWVNHYKNGSSPKNMHRDGWGRNRGVNITLTASFGATRTLTFEAVSRNTVPQTLECPQSNGDIFAFGHKVNEAFKHGVPPEPHQGPRISIVVMGRAPADWLPLDTLRAPSVQGTTAPASEEASTGSRRRWGLRTACGDKDVQGTPCSDSDFQVKRESVEQAPAQASRKEHAQSKTCSSADPQRGNKNSISVPETFYGDSNTQSTSCHSVDRVGLSSGACAPEEVPAEATEQRDAQSKACAPRRWRGSARGEAVHVEPGSKLGRGRGACLVWLRDDLRLTDHPALHHALESNPAAVVPLFVHDDADPSPWPIRGAALWWKGESLASFDASLRQHCKSRLIIRRGSPFSELLSVARSVGATHVFFNRMVEPWYRERDLQVTDFLQRNGIVVETFKSAVLQEPWEGSPPLLPKGQNDAPAVAWDEVEPGKLLGQSDVQVETGKGTGVTNLTMQQVVSIINADRLLSNPNPCAQLLTALGDMKTENTDHRRRDPDHFLVYQAIEAGASLIKPLPTVEGRPFPSPEAWPDTLTFRDLGYSNSCGRGFPREGMPQEAARKSGADWASDMRKAWSPGEKAALTRLKHFVDNIETHKRPDRHRGDLPNTSLLSPHLRFGEISARTCYFEALRAPALLRHGFIRRVLWRDLSYAELYLWPDMPSKSQRPHYEEQAWFGTDAQLRRWQRGRTGFPLIDAAMRQLWREGYINNYLRHVVAGFLIDYLNLSWKHGLDWFDYTLVDADTAINARLWQQGGHSGISQWNFVMHPVYAAKNADPEGAYVRRWVPELAALPTEFIHQPWEAPYELDMHGIKLGKQYCKRMLLDLDDARKRHLRSVMQVRRNHPDMVSKDGTEYLQLKDGSRVLLRTRDDIRQDTDKLIVKQTPGEDLHKKGRRQQVSANSWRSLLEL